MQSDIPWWKHILYGVVMTPLVTYFIHDYAHLLTPNNPSVIPIVSAVVGLWFVIGYALQKPLGVELDWRIGLMNFAGGALIHEAGHRILFDMSQIHEVGVMVALVGSVGYFLNDVFPPE